jgi:hypothetical protein
MLIMVPTSGWKRDESGRATAAALLADADSGRATPRKDYRQIGRRGTRKRFDMKKVPPYL